jgi:hypothetical protein
MTAQTWDITPNDPDYSGPTITLTDGPVYVARSGDPAAPWPTDGVWVLMPVTLLQYIDQECIRANGDHDAARAFNDALDAAFPDGPPGGCGGYIELAEPCSVHGSPDIRTCPSCTRGYH